MARYTSVKVTVQTLRKLHQIAAKLSIERGKQLNLDETISAIMDIAERVPEREDANPGIPNDDLRTFLALLGRKIKAAGPEDYMPYDFEDMIRP